jgi:penicillin-insensitive murein endopeptidase
MMIGHLTAGASGNADLKVIATPDAPAVTPGPGLSPLPAPSAIPSPAASRIPSVVANPTDNPYIFVHPNPSPSPFDPLQPWNPYPWLPTPPKPNPPKVVNGKIEIPTDLFSIFTRNFPQSFGLYDRGHLEHPDMLPLTGPGFEKVFRERDRGYGSLDVITLIEGASQEIHRFLPRVSVVQIGDIAAAKGGPIGGHASHQNGLDADIAFFNTKNTTMPTTGSKSKVTGFATNYVDRKGKVSSEFDVEANWKMVQILIASGHVDRIFADQHIKKEFCEYAVAHGMREEWKETLRKIRHWPDHQDHMHVRIICPTGSTKCEPIAAIPAGDGCDSFLDKIKNGIQSVIRMDGELVDPGEKGDDESGTLNANEHGC